MNIQDEMDRIFKMQKDNLANERKFIQRCKNGVGEWEVLPNFETFDTRKEAEDFLDGERKSSEDEERNLYCVCGELKTACPDGYAYINYRRNA
jgi:DNA polymerase III alpha subunit